MSRNYYEILGLKKDATTDDIKKAYKELAKKYHPDVSKEENATEKFKEINEAYSVLSDSEKKQNYDSYGEAYKNFQGYNQQGFGHGTDFDFEDLFNNFSGFGGSFGFGDINDLFGGARRGQRKDNGSNIRINLSIKFEEAVSGTTKEINYERVKRCEKCSGTGAEGELKNCPQCNGRGVEVKQQRTPFGIFQMQTTCKKCSGTGKVAEKQCRECDGNGFITVDEKLKVKIPAGINTGNHLRLQGKGNEGKHGSGDLFIVMLVEKNDVFKRDDEDIYAEVPISFAEAALGATIEVPTLEGKADLHVPSGTQSGTIFKMKGKGIKKLDSNEKGDEYIKVIIETPKKMSKKQKDLLEQLRNEENASKKRKGLFDRIFH